jgi:hypothetical protein
MIARSGFTASLPLALDKHELYELTVQSPPDVVRMLRALHGGQPRVLGEDFCGTAALARAWIAHACAVAPIPRGTPPT